ncbi:ABC transporter substrate-binding protein [Pendulispora brunnea]|uniref:ABC transporter substrate-binding protein n=1 Tax=Pendulispora brunnea TaxID=2905690 RepID=A0ABZ2KMT0_9BACT
MRFAPVACVSFLACAVGCNVLLDASKYHVGSEDEDSSLACTKNDDCRRAMGDDGICPASTLRCARIRSAECTRVLGDATSDDAVIIGSLFPLEQTSGAPIENGVEVAFEDFRSVGLPPVPGGTRRRPLVLVACNDQADGPTAVRAAKHLTDDLGVPAIIGSGFSNITLQVANQVTIPKNVLLISPSSTSPTLTHLTDNGLVWRTCPSDLIQAEAHLALMPHIEHDVKLATGAEKIKVAVLHKGDPYGRGLVEALSPKLVFNGARALDQVDSGFFLRRDYGDPQDPNAQPDYPATVRDIVAVEPHVIFLYGTTETVTQLIAQTEATWHTSLGYRPFYVMADGSAVPELSTYLASVPDDTRRRMLGTKPGTVGPNFEAFKSTYLSRVHDGTSPAATWAVNAYDALYTVAFSIVAVGADPLRGPSLAHGFERLVSGPRISPGSSSVNGAFDLLLAGTSIDYDGASGPLDFDRATGEAPSDILIWCMQRDEGPQHSDTPSEPRITPVYYSASDRKLAGGLPEIRAFCGF